MQAPFRLPAAGQELLPVSGYMALGCFLYVQLTALCQGTQSTSCPMMVYPAVAAEAGLSAQSRQI